MHSTSIERWVHDHAFGQDLRKSGESRTKAVIAVTAFMMAVEIAAGLLFGSIALLADGLHMASHASALTISALAYYYTRRHARDERFNFGTGKINSLAGFASAVLLAGFALLMASESLGRMLNPVKIEFNQAIGVAVIGLAVNVACLLVLGNGEHMPGGSDHEHGDHNLWSAYLHVLADAATSVLAILALIAAKYFALVLMDPLMGLVGAGLVTHWSLGLIRSTSRVLLDMGAPAALRRKIRDAIEAHEDDRVVDLHVWAIGPDIYSAEIGVVSSNPKSPDHYRDLLPPGLKIVHSLVQVHRCPDHEGAAALR